MVDRSELAIEPEVDIDHRNAIEAIQLAEVSKLLPGLGEQELERIHGQGTDVGIGRDRATLLALDATDPEPLHPTILGQADLAQWRIEMHLSPPGGDVINDRLAETLGRVAIKEGHLGTITLLKKAIQGREHHGA